MSFDVSGFYFITDSSLTKHGALKDAEDAIRGGAKVVQYREKNKPFGDMVEEARALLALCRKSGVLFIVNDSLELALEVSADGLHIGPHDMSLHDARKAFDGIIGISCGSLADVKEAEKNGADYVAASPMFFTCTKKDIGQPLGLEGIALFRKSTELPIVAIGGITRKNVREVMLAGADSVCAISATVGTNDVQASVKWFVEAIAAAQKVHN
ncbi:MAG: thiamine phosphate synthase [Thermoplasmata archaeon]|nr:thiamine phosphate synthase [Thermoplasmata archaeon]